LTELEAEYEYMELHPEVRPAIAKFKEPVLDDDGFVKCHEIRERFCAVHTLQVGRGGWVCEFEDGTTHAVPYENVRFVDGEDEDD
jgi:hypothetical protein